MRPALHVYVLVLLPLLTLLAAQFQIGCEGSCPLWREFIGNLTAPLALGWVALVIWGVVRVLRARFR